MVDFKDELWMNVWYTLSNQGQLFVLYSRSNQKLLKSFSSRRFLSKQLGYFLTDSVLTNTRDSSCNPAHVFLAHVMWFYMCTSLCQLFQ